MNVSPSLPGVPDEVVDAVAEGNWLALDSWLQAQQVDALPPTPLPSGELEEFWARWYRGFATEGFLQSTARTPMSLYGLQPLLRAPALQVLQHLHVSAHWPGPEALVFGPHAPRVLKPAKLLPALVESVLATAPASLRHLSVWLPQNPPWNGEDDCVSQLAPLTRLRPWRAHHLTLRAPSKGLLQLLGLLANSGWATITVKSKLGDDELTQLRTLAHQTPRVHFEVMQSGAQCKSLGPSNLWWVDDAARATVEVDGRGIELEPNRGLLPQALAALFAPLGLTLKSELGFWELSLHRLAGDRAFLNGEPFTSPRALRRDEYLTVRLERVPRPGVREPLVQQLRFRFRQPLF